MSRRSFGAATDYYRIRLVRVDDTDSPDLEWRDDVLYRRPGATDVIDRDVWKLEAVDVGDDERSVLLGEYIDGDEAHSALAEAEQALADSTLGEFVASHFPSQDERD